MYKQLGHSTGRCMCWIMKPLTSIDDRRYSLSRPLVCGCCRRWSCGWELRGKAVIFCAQTADFVGTSKKHCDDSAFSQKDIKISVVSMCVFMEFCPTNLWNTGKTPSLLIPFMGMYCGCNRDIKGFFTKLGILHAWKHGIEQGTCAI